MISTHQTSYRQCRTFPVTNSKSMQSAVLTWRATSAIESCWEEKDTSTKPFAAADSTTDVTADEPFPDCMKLSHVVEIQINNHNIMQLCASSYLTTYGQQETRSPDIPVCAQPPQMRRSRYAHTTTPPMRFPQRIMSTIHIS